MTVTSVYVWKGAGKIVIEGAVWSQVGAELRRGGVIVTK
jgi:formylmethanofuran dehydrogenase subunit C